MSKQISQIRKAVAIREDFRRDGLAGSFLVGKELFEVFVAAFPVGTRFNIGYPSICDAEFETCRSILEIDRTGKEFCVVGRARIDDLETMARLLSGQEDASANIWLPASKQSATNILNCDTEEVFRKAITSIRYWKKISGRPLDIALTDVTCSENGLIDRIHSWAPRLFHEGYRDIILCDTKGVAQLDELTDLFSAMPTFEWHPHNDNGNAYISSLLALNAGATRIGTSFLNFSERMNMLDPRELLGDNICMSKIQEFTTLLAETCDPEQIRNIIFSPQSIITGIHYLLWGRKNSKEMYFGVTSNQEVASILLERNIDNVTLRFLKDELLYKQRNLFLTKEELNEKAGVILSIFKNVC